jgi:hypothetical protein
MERLRPPRPDQDASLETIGPLPTRVSLAELMEAVRSPGVLRTYVDAFLRGLVRPLAEDETPRARADFLLSLIESQEIGELQGSNGRTVRATAVKALLDLGYPYALEVPPEALAEARLPLEAWLSLEARPQEIPVPGLIATGVGLLVQLGYCMPALATHLKRGDSGAFLSIILILGLVLGPGASAVLGGWLRIRRLQQFGLFSMALTGCLWLASAAFPAFAPLNPLTDPDTWLHAVTGFGFLLGAFLMRRSEWLAPSATPSKDTPPQAKP